MSLEGAPLNLYTIYERPLDYPEGFIVRHWVASCGRVEPREVVGTAATLDEAREFLPFGLCNLGRKPEDTPSTVETWV